LHLGQMPTPSTCPTCDPSRPTFAPSCPTLVHSDSGSVAGSIPATSTCRAVRCPGLREKCRPLT
jgi:hypothetical protein